MARKEPGRIDSDQPAGIAFQIITFDPANLDTRTRLELQAGIVALVLKAAIAFAPLAFLVA